MLSCLFPEKNTSEESIPFACFPHALKLYQGQSNKENLSFFSKFKARHFCFLFNKASSLNCDIDLLCIGLRMYPEIIFDVCQDISFMTHYDKLMPFVNGKILSEDNKTFLFRINDLDLLAKILESPIELDVNHLDNNNTTFLNHIFNRYIEIKSGQINRLLHCLKKRNYNTQYLNNMGRIIFPALFNDINLGQLSTDRTQALVLLLSETAIDPSQDILWLKIYIKKSRESYSHRDDLQLGIILSIFGRKDWRECFINIFNAYISEYFSAEKDLFDFYAQIKKVIPEKAQLIFPMLPQSPAEKKLAASLFNMTKLWDAMAHGK